MKKKIVYISGGDAFDVNDVRAAFEEVRNTLNLDSDTLLFGVPVDEPVQVADVQPEPVSCAPDIAIDVTPDDNVVPEPEIESDSTPENNSDIAIDDSENAVPILSVLATSEEKSGDTDSEIIIESEHTVLSDTDVTDKDDDITEMLNTTVPEDGEKTLEELLESMAPLREDVHNEPEMSNTGESESTAKDDVDATLENLASEFVETQDKMPSAKKTSERGKIGKLKNILPFKKMKKDDSGLMGDLFGWAGIAANDEDFSIPGFFTNAASKK
jgi:hypothetical protein